MLKKIVIGISLIFIIGCEQKIGTSVSELVKTESTPIKELKAGVIYEYPYLLSNKEKICETEESDSKDFFKTVRQNDDTTELLLSQRVFWKNDDVFILQGNLFGDKKSQNMYLFFKNKEKCEEVVKLLDK